MLKKIGSHIKQLRETSGLDQVQFGKSIGISQTSVSDLENGKYPPSKPILLAIENQYSISPSQILTGKNFSLDHLHKPAINIKEPSALSGSEIASLFPLTTFGDAVDKLRFIYESNNHILTAATLANLSAFEFSLKIINELSNIKDRLSYLEDVLDKHKPPKNTDERREAWIQIQNLSKGDL